MSVVVSLAFVVLCFSYRASNARSFGKVGGKEVAGEFHPSITKKSEALSSARVSTWPDTTKSLTNPNGHNNVDSEIIDPKKQIESKGADDVAEEAVASSVSWKVPHDRKRNEQEPGFNLDYLPPKTHPPSHN